VWLNLPAGYILFGAKWSICETVDLTESEKKFMNNEVKVKVKQSRYKPEVAQMVPES